LTFYEDRDRSGNTFDQREAYQTAGADFGSIFHFFPFIFLPEAFIITPWRFSPELRVLTSLEAERYESNGNCTQN
jgi:hypothetical protein